MPCTNHILIVSFFLPRYSLNDCLSDAQQTSSSARSIGAIVDLSASSGSVARASKIRRIQLFQTEHSSDGSVSIQFAALEPILSKDAKALEQTKHMVADYQKGD